MSSNPPDTSPRYMGGQAVVEGVMMRGERTWAVSVRTPEGDIQTEVHDAPAWAERWSKIPLVRGVMALGESMALGFKALSWSANIQLPEEERISGKAMGWTIGIALAFFTAIFIVLPAVAANGIGNIFGLSGFWFHVAEGALRLSIFLGYLLLIGCLKDIKRVFQYHGAEHKAIAAVRERRAAHARVGAAVHDPARALRHQLPADGDGRHDHRVLVRRPPVVALIMIASRIVLIPFIAGLSYEVIRYAARHMQYRWVRILMRPGLLLQKLTTREPSLDQVEVAIVSLRAVLTAEQLAEVNARAAYAAPAPTTRPAIA